MVRLNEKQIKKLKVGDEVIYKETDGELRNYHYKAIVTEIYPYYILLNVIANEELGYTFKTSFAFNYPAAYVSARLYKVE